MLLPPRPLRAAGALTLGLSLLLVTPAGAQPAPAPSPALRSAVASRAPRRGDHGAPVEELQQRLRDLGFVLARDGDFGPTTERTVKAFQTMRGLSPSGRVDRDTLAALDDAAAHPSLHRGERGETVKELQRLLNHAKQHLAVDGDYGPRTQGGVRAYQASRSGLAASGAADHATLARLRLEAARVDSLIEGLGETPPPAQPAPTPPAPSTPSAPRAVPKIQRPTERSSQSEAYARGLAWARIAKAAGRSTLIVNFEGLWSFSPAFAEKVYAYHHDLLAGRRPRPPRVGAMSFMAKNLIAPQLLRHYRSVELLLLPETAEHGRGSSVGEATVRAWHQVFGARLKLVITGHSFGGLAALRLAKRLERRGIPVAAMLTVDARSPVGYREFVRPRNVRRLLNDYHKGFVMPGYAIDGATNRRIRGVSHGSIVSSSIVRDHYRQVVER